MLAAEAASSVRSSMACAARRTDQAPNGCQEVRLTVDHLMVRRLLIPLAACTLVGVLPTAPAQAATAPTIAFPNFQVTYLSVGGRGCCAHYSVITGASISPSSWASTWAQGRCDAEVSDGTTTWSTSSVSVGSDGISLSVQFGGTLSNLTRASVKCGFTRTTTSGLSWGYKAVNPYETAFTAKNTNDLALRAHCSIRYAVLGGTKTESWNPWVSGDGRARTTQWYIHVRGMSCDWVQTVSARASASPAPPPPPPPHPPAPTDLVAQPEDGTVAVDLSWACSAGATDYEVIRTLDGGSLSVAGYTGGTCSFRDDPTTQLQPGTLYHYQVVAENSYGASDFSNTADATTWSPPPPLAPSNLAAVPENGSIAVDLSWDCSAGATDYEVDRAPDEGAWSTVAASTSGQCSFRDASTQLQPGTLYHYQVVAENSYGGSPAASVDATTWTPPPAPTPTVYGTCPPSVYCAGTAPYLVVEWTPSTTSDTWATAGFPAQNIYVSGTDGFTPDTPVTSMPDPGGSSGLITTDDSGNTLVCGQTYYVVLITSSSTGRSAPSAPSSAVVTC